MTAGDNAEKPTSVSEGKTQLNEVDRAKVVYYYLSTLKTTPYPHVLYQSYER